MKLIGFGNTFFDDPNTIDQDAFPLVNTRLGYEFDNYGIYLFANNLFDTEYVTQAFDLSGPVAVFGAPRTFGVQVRTHF